MPDLPSKQIDDIAGVFKLSNSIGSTQLDWMEENREEVINQNPAVYIEAILKYLDQLATPVGP